MMFLNLTRRQSLAVECLLTADSVTEAARQAGVGRTTLYAWLKKPHFQRALSEARGAGHQARLNRLRRLVPSAIEALQGLISSNDQWVRLGAAREILRAHRSLLPEEAYLGAPGRAPLEEPLTLSARLSERGAPALEGGSPHPKAIGPGDGETPKETALEEVVALAREIAAEQMEEDAALRDKTMELLGELVCIDPKGDPGLAEFQKRAFEHMEVLREAAGLPAHCDLFGLKDGAESAELPGSLKSLPSPSGSSGGMEGTNGQGTSGRPDGPESPNSPKAPGGDGSK